MSFYSRFSKSGLIGVVTLLYFLTGCSSGSLSPRYGSKENQKEKENINYVPFDSLSFYGKNDTLLVLDEMTDLMFDDDTDEDYVSVKINRDSLIQFLSRATGTTDVTEKDKIIFEVIKYLDTPYRYGGTTGSGLDCSAFTGTVYRNSIKINLPRSSADQFGVGEKITDQDDLQFGDLVFFQTRRRARVSHVGIYLGDRYFAHASTSSGVTVSSLDETYYKKRYVGARRLVDGFSSK